MVGNGTISYDHERDGRPTELGGCNAMVRNLKHDTFLFIRYVSRRLTVRNAHFILMYQSEEGMSGLAIFFTVLFSMLGCIFLIVIGIVVYSQWNERRRKRFY
ncbi:hypothetical protein GOODEAATRI_001146 [Goodea atripinnis]|uniref:L-type lectin-like domain-containing protein n=1 Tax=Goodea atripinnis TaxID=208336 RepID=A0ABV0P0R8_9TELE